ncbi:MAG: DUF2804 domain-containing protein [Promethearchaeia archaeon]
MQHEITKPSKLLREDGSLKQRGWGRKPILIYNRENVAVPWYRIKEWEHYSVLDKKQGFGFQMTLGDIGYLTLMGFTWLDFNSKESTDWGSIKFLTRGKYTFPKSSLEPVRIPFPGRNFSALIEQKKGKRILSVNYPNWALKGLKANIVLFDNPNYDNTVVATGYKEDHRKFYYNHKINYMPAKGWVTIGKGSKMRKFRFCPESSFGLLDWGRGVWPYRTHWLWGSACARVDGVPVAFNIGYGFGDLSTHTENIVFYDGKAHKLDKVFFENHSRDPTKPWQFHSNDGRFEMELTPLIPQSSRLDLGVLKSDSVLLHGYYSGYVILDDGSKIEIENMLGHAEDIFWRW